MRVTEEMYEELMKKRQGWKPGRVIYPTQPPATSIFARRFLATPCGRENELGGERPGEETKIQGNPAPPRQPGRSKATAMRTARQAQQKATGEVVRKESAIEIMLAQQIHLLKLPVPKRNYLFMPGRRLELDFAWPERKIAVEVQGMVHRIHGRFCADIEKRALALLAGWKILEVGGKEIRNGVASQWIEQLLRTSE